MIFRFIAQLVPPRVVRLIVASFVVAAWGFMVGLVALAIGVSQIASVVIACGTTAALTGGTTWMASRGVHAAVSADAVAGSMGALALAAILQFYGV